MSDLQNLLASLRNVEKSGGLGSGDLSQGFSKKLRDDDGSGNLSGMNMNSSGMNMNNNVSRNGNGRSKKFSVPPRLGGSAMSSKKGFKTPKRILQGSESMPAGLFGGLNGLNANMNSSLVSELTAPTSELGGIGTGVGTGSLYRSSSSTLGFAGGGGGGASLEGADYGNSYGDEQYDQEDGEGEGESVCTKLSSLTRLSKPQPNYKSQKSKEATRNVDTVLRRTPSKGKKGSSSSSEADNIDNVDLLYEAETMMDNLPDMSFVDQERATASLIQDIVKSSKLLAEAPAEVNGGKLAPHLLVFKKDFDRMQKTRVSKARLEELDISYYFILFKVKNSIRQI